MVPAEKELLNAIHDVKIDVRELRTKIDESVNGRFKDIERRTTKIEEFQNKIVWVVISSVILAVMSIILK